MYKKNVYIQMLIFLCALIYTFLTSCTQQKQEPEQPTLDTLLQKTTFLSTDLSGESVKELVFDNTYKIENEDGITYRLLRDHADVGDKYIFAVIAESGGGSGVFYDLHAVDKQTLRTVDTAALGDRVRIEKMSIVDKSNDILSITYWTKGDGFEPSKKIEDTFQIKSNSNEFVRRLQ